MALVVTLCAIIKDIGIIFEENMSKKTIIICIISGGVVLLALALILFNSMKKEISCQSDIGSISIFYNRDGIQDFSSSGQISFDSSNQRQIARDIGIDNYLDEFERWFKENTGGTCER